MSKDVGDHRRILMVGPPARSDAVRSHLASLHFVLVEDS